MTLLGDYYNSMKLAPIRLDSADNVRTRRYSGTPFVATIPGDDATPRQGRNNPGNVPSQEIDDRHGFDPV